VIGLSCHRRLRSCLRRLNAGVEASGPHDFAVRTLALSSAAPPASTASHPASVTIAIRPSGGQDGGGYRSDLGQTERGKILKMGLDRGINGPTALPALPSFGSHDAARVNRRYTNPGILICKADGGCRPTPNCSPPKIHVRLALALGGAECRNESAPYPAISQ
jgi:hypothetical protein